MKVPIGIFDSGYGGLTVLKSIQNLLPNYDCIYLGDNARAPYGARSFEVINQYTLEAVEYLFNQNCPIVILACNTSSAKALRTIQQIDLKYFKDPSFRVIGVIRPSTESIGSLSKNNCIGVLGTEGTIQSGSYKIELEKFSPKTIVIQHACPMWVPLIESNQHQTDIGKKLIESDIRELLVMSPSIDTVLLACTHYPLIIDEVKKIVGEKITVVSQGPIVADKLSDYLERNEFMKSQLSEGGSCTFLTTENATIFNALATRFLEIPIAAEQIRL